MTINFIGNFANGYVGEVADETHLANELQLLGHKVNRVPRDQWKAYVDGEEVQEDWWLPIPADINIICKWHHFNDKKYVTKLKETTNAPTFYWVWDYMDDSGFADWHLQIAQAADLYLSGELGLASAYQQRGVKFYYFQMDVCDGDILTQTVPHDFKNIDVLFTGSYLGQGDRIEFLTKINEMLPGQLKIYSWNYTDWQNKGFDAMPAVYGGDYNRLISKAKIVLGMSVEPHCYGYWSNRVGKVIKAKGFLLQQYAPGMEQFLPLTGVDYFSTPEEAVEKIKKRLADQSYAFSSASATERDRFTSADKMKRLSILIDRYLTEKGKFEWILP